MILEAPDELIAAVPRGSGRLLGLDLGSKTIGLALSDSTWRIASALKTIRRTRFRADADRLFATIDAHGIAAVVLGLPLNMDGSAGPRAQSTRQFARNVLALRDLPILLWDERLSTAAVERLLIEQADRSRKRRGEIIDKLAAAYILQGLLDRLRTV